MKSTLPSHDNGFPSAPRGEAEFQNEVLRGVGHLVSDMSRLTAETRGAIEELTEVKNQVGSLDQTVAALKKVQVHLAHEQRMAHGDPRQRILGSEEKRAAFSAAVRNACRIGGVQVRDLGEGSTPGSTLIVPLLANEIYDTLARYGSWSTLGVRRVGSRITQYPVKTARASASFVLTDGSAIPDDSTKAGTTVDLDVEVIGSLISVSRQLLEDSTFDVTADVLDDFVESFNYRLDYAAFTGAGTADATNGGFTGIFTAATPAVAATGGTTIGALKVDDFVNVLTTVDSGVLNRPCAWWLHPQTLARIVTVKDSMGRPIFLSSTEAPTPAGIGTILGYPVHLVYAAPNTNTAGATVAVFGDPQAAVVGLRTDFSFEASDEYLWNTYQRSFRGVGRAGVAIRKATGFAALQLAAS